MESNDPQSRLERGETLVLIDQWKTYISYEDGEFVTRGILDKVEREAKQSGATPTYQIRRYTSLVDALLSMLDDEWLQ